MLDIRDHGGLFGGVDRNKYKRWASGVVFVPTGSTKFTISNLSFTPSLILARGKDTNEKFRWFSVLENATQKSGALVGTDSVIGSSTATSSGGVSVINDNGFTISVPVANWNYVWIAYE